MTLLIVFLGILIKFFFFFVSYVAPLEVCQGPLMGPGGARGVSYISVYLYPSECFPHHAERFWDSLKLDL